MSRVVKNSRRCRPRARWKMLAPCMTVLSTSKNAADAGSTGWLRAASTSAADAAADSPDRLAICESGGRRVTWGALEDEVARLATGLGSTGIVAGHRVMIVL